MTTRKLSFALAFLFVGTLQVKALTVVYIDPLTGKEIEIRGIGPADSTESAAGLMIKKGTGYAITHVKVGMTIRRDAKQLKLTFPIAVPPTHIKDYQLGEPDVAPLPYLLEFRPPLSLVERAANPTVKEVERVRLLKELLPLFAALKPKIANLARVRRHVEFKHAEALYRLAEALSRLSQVDAKDEKARAAAEAAGKEAEKTRADAMTTLAAYPKDNSDGFQVGPALMMLAQLQEDTGDLASVQKTYQDLAALPGLSEELKISSLINAARTLMKLGKFGDAKTNLTTLNGTLQPDNPLKSKVQLYLAQCQLLGENATEAQQAEKQLRQILAATDDKSVKALAHNTLGDYYVKLKQDENAFWEYLRVDMLYGEADRVEHSRALYHLIRLFREVKKDADRSLQVEDLLTKDPRFSGLEYQKKALKK